MIGVDPLRKVGNPMSEDSEFDLYLTLALSGGHERPLAARIAKRLDIVARSREQLMELSSRAVAHRLQEARRLAQDAAPSAGEPSEAFIAEIAEMLRAEIAVQANALHMVASNEKMQAAVDELRANDTPVETRN